MEYSNLRVEKRPPLAVVTLNRPKALNALNAATLAELESAFEDLAADIAVRVVLLTGTGGRAFAAGADIREFTGSLVQRSKGSRVHGRPAGDRREHPDARARSASRVAGALRRRHPGDRSGGRQSVQLVPYAGRQAADDSHFRSQGHAGKLGVDRPADDVAQQRPAHF